MLREKTQEVDKKNNKNKRYENIQYNILVMTTVLFQGTQ